MLNTINTIVYRFFLHVFLISPVLAISKNLFKMNTGIMISIALVSSELIHFLFASGYMYFLWISRFGVCGCVCEVELVWRNRVLHSACAEVWRRAGRSTRLASCCHRYLFQSRMDVFWLTFSCFFRWKLAYNWQKRSLRGRLMRRCGCRSSVCLQLCEFAEDREEADTSLLCFWWAENKGCYV